ncbi:MAG: electron transfer flavoprotein-ubiquinone oxidoreductase [Pseudomonadota bacterium]|nr:electron transfer flavoprotein-ubiquinone oxidoreductase [Pseudomonadota bacterium]
MQREAMPVDVLFVGGGPACLAGAIRLLDLIQGHNAAVDAGGPGAKLEEPTIALMDKGSEIGSHAISGAVLDTRALDELIPGWERQDPTFVERHVEEETFVVLTKTMAFPAPLMPPGMEDHGSPIISIAKFQKWLAAKAEEKGLMLFSGFAGTQLLWEGDTVIGVRTGDKGIGPDGQPKGTFEAGIDIMAKVTILGEGPRGTLARQLINRLGLDKESQPQVYEIGVKEVIEMPPGTVKKGEVILTLGYPLDLHTFGGAFVYAMADDKYAIGLLVELGAQDPAMDAHYLLQKLKAHPYMRKKLGAGKVVKYGAKAVTVGGWASIPKLYADGAMIVGDSASFLNPARIKGIHLSMKAGMLAAETAFDALRRGDSTEAVLAEFKTRVDGSWIREEMEPAKNFHAGFDKGVIGGMAAVGMSLVFGPGEDIKPFDADFEHMKKVAHVHGHKGMPARDEVVFDNVYLVDKLTDVYHSGTKHEEKQPSHLKVVDREICATQCAEEYGNPCTRFCPAQVYNMHPNPTTGRAELQIDFSNCVHCKTCDIRDPYQIITWVPPEGGNGPEYGIL